MTLLPFNIKDNYFALEIKDIIEIIPLVRIENVVDSNPLLSGLINYRGNLIPIVDLNYFFYKESSEKILSTRIIIYNYQEQTLGLIVEDLTDTIEIDKNKLIIESEKLSGSNYIRAYFIEGEKTLKIIDATKIFDLIYKQI